MFLIIPFIGQEFKDEPFSYDHVKPPTYKIEGPDNNTGFNSGRWTDEEHLRFLIAMKVSC